MTGSADYDAIVLAGGRASRMDGVDKPMQVVGDRPLLVRALAAVSDADRRIVVGPERDLAADVDVCWTTEQPPVSGPVAAIAAGLALTTADVIVVLAADLPWIAAAVGPLRAALGVAGASADTVADASNDAPTDASTDASTQPSADSPQVAVIRTAGRDNYLAAAWHREALVGALNRLLRTEGAESVAGPKGAAVRQLYDGVRTAVVDDLSGWGEDCDTWDDLANARARANLT